MYVFCSIGKNAYALFLHILCVIYRLCLATVGAMCFSCVASAAHFLFYGGKKDEKEKNEKIMGNIAFARNVA